MFYSETLKNQTKAVRGAEEREYTEAMDKPTNWNNDKGNYVSDLFFKLSIFPQNENDGKLLLWPMSSNKFSSSDIF